MTIEGEESLQKWLEKYPFHVHIKEDMKGITYEPVYEENAYTKILSIVFISIQENVWGRLKACPDCRWYFTTIREMGAKDGAVCMLEKKEEERAVQLQK